MNARYDGDMPRREVFLFADDDKRIIRHSLGTGATPLTTTNRPEVAKRQEKVERKLRGRIASNLKDRSPLIRKFAEQNFLARFARRLDRNRASYDTRLVEEVPEEICAPHERVLVGDGSPSEALTVMLALRMRSIELARLTHPDTDMQNNPELDGMRSDVYDAVLEHGGRYYDDIRTDYELTNIDTVVPCEEELADGRPVENTAVREGVMVTAKRHIAELPDGTKVVERTSYIIDLNELPSEISSVIRSVNTLNNENSLQEITDAAQLDTLFPYLIERGAEETSVIPISTTVYAYNETIAQRIADQQSQLKNTEQSELMKKLTVALEQDEAEQKVLWALAEAKEQKKRELEKRQYEAEEQQAGSLERA